MKITHAGKLLLISMGFLWFPGCGRIVKWAKNHVDQGTPLPDTTEIPQRSIRSIKIYDEFTLAASFDALWLSDEVRNAYAVEHALKHGTSTSIKKAFARRQIEENKHFIMFFVLTNYTLSFGEPMSSWSLFLETDTLVQPTEIKVVDLSPEYRSFFGKKLNRFKTAYSVKFNAKDNEGNYILTDATQALKLHFRSVNKETVLVWRLSNRKLDNTNEEPCS